MRRAGVLRWEAGHLSVSRRDLSRTIPSADDRAHATLHSPAALVWHLAREEFRLPKSCSNLTRFEKEDDLALRRFGSRFRVVTRSPQRSRARRSGYNRSDDFACVEVLRRFHLDQLCRGASKARVRSALSAHARVT